MSKQDSDAMKFLSSFKGYVSLFHNGSRVLECYKGDLALKFISAITSVNFKHHPVLIANEFLDDCTELGGERLLIIYQYSDCNMDMFLVETN